MTDTKPDERTGDVPDEHAADAEPTERPSDASNGRPSDDASVESTTDRPKWDDEYLDRVADRLQYTYDLEQGDRVRGESFALSGRLAVHNQKKLFHPALSYGHHESKEHLFVRRADSVTVPELERLISLGHDLADDRIDADEEHYSTEFTFALVVPEIPDDVRTFVSGFRDRTLLKYGFFGHYEINLVIVAPDRETLVASQNAETASALRLWDDVSRDEPGLFERFVRSMWH